MLKRQAVPAVTLLQRVGLSCTDQSTVMKPHLVMSWLHAGVSPGCGPATSTPSFPKTLTTAPTSRLRSPVASRNHHSCLFVSSSSRSKAQYSSRKRLHASAPLADFTCCLSTPGLFPQLQGRVLATLLATTPQLCIPFSQLRTYPPSVADLRPPWLPYVLPVMSSEPSSPLSRAADLRSLSPHPYAPRH